MHKRIPITVPHLPPSVIEAAKECLESTWIGQNKKVDEFEDIFCNKFGYRHAIAVNSCTSALRLALAVSKVGVGDEVITTPNTFVATNTAILEQGAKPVFADIQYHTGNIEPEDIKYKITDKTKAIMIVHFMGYPCDINEIYALVDEVSNHRILVIEDCAQAIGAKYHAVPVGSNEFGCFSFQSVKQITSVDGGMLTTKYEETDEEARIRSWFGLTKKGRSQSAHTGVCNYDIKLLGFKYKMNAVAAAMAQAQLPYVDNILKARALKAEIYREELGGVHRLEVFEDDTRLHSSNFMFPIHVEERGYFLRKMAKANIEAFVHNFRNDRFSIFGAQVDSNTGFVNYAYDLPVMKEFDKTHVCLPLHHELSIEDQLYIIDTIKEGW